MQNKVISLSLSEYPEFKDLSDGQSVEFKITGKKSKSDDKKVYIEVEKHFMQDNPAESWLRERTAENVAKRKSMTKPVLEDVDDDTEEDDDEKVFSKEY